MTATQTRTTCSFAPIRKKTFDFLLPTQSSSLIYGYLTTYQNCKLFYRFLPPIPGVPAPRSHPPFPAASGGDGWAGGREGEGGGGEGRVEVGSRNRKLVSPGKRMKGKSGGNKVWHFFVKVCKLSLLHLNTENVLNFSVHLKLNFAAFFHQQ